MKKYLLAAIPLVLALALALAWRFLGWPDPVLYLRADAATTVLLLGVVLTLAGETVALTWAQAIGRAGRVLTVMQQDEADAHRRFIRRLDHELKNPLTAMRIVLANSPSREDDPTIAAVRSQVDRIARVSADLRKLADLEAQPLEVEPVDVAELLKEVAETVRKRPEPAAQRLQLVLPRAPWPVSHVAGDRDLLFLALHNLLDNACKFVRAEDTIEVRAIEDGAFVLIEVADTGPGVPDEDLPHLGEELYRGSAPRSVEGSGLGLALVRAIVNRHGGSMAIRSRLGQGTVVSLRLPVAR